MARRGIALDVVVDGLSDFRADLKAIGKDAAKDGRVMLAGAAQIIADAAKHDAPKRSGKLAENIKGTTRGQRAAVVVSGTRVPYGNLIHWGGTTGPGKHGPGSGPSHIRGNPFIEKAAGENAEAVAEAVAKGLDELMAKHKFGLRAADYLSSHPLQSAVPE
jgi:HK97 gp10 family phage protein